MAITLSLISDELDNEDLQQLTRQLCDDLRDEAGVEASLAKQEAEAGAKGSEVEILGKILLAMIGAGGPIVALIGVLKVYAQRKPSLQFEIQKKGGDKVKIKADDLNDDDMTRLVQTIKKTVEGIE